MTFTFTFPYKLLSRANTSEHWSKTSKRNGQIRNILALFMKNYEGGVPCHVHMVRIAPRALDDDNLVSAFKTVRDSLADFLIPGLYTYTRKKGNKIITTISSNSRGKRDSDPRLSFSCSQEKGNPKEYFIRIQIIPK